MIRMQSLNQNKQFRQLLKQNKLNSNYFTIYFGKIDYYLNKKNNNLNISFVTKKKIGTAVKRNKIRRRLKSAVQKIIKNSKSVNLNYSYVIFGKADVYNDKFSYIYDEVSNVFNKIKNFKN